jgi:hypothetical protein
VQNDTDLTTSARDFLDQLTVGNSARSLGERQALALAGYQPLVERLNTGDLTAFDEFRQKSEVLLAIEREIYGSQSGYWQRLEEVKALTEAALENLRMHTNDPLWITDKSIIDWWTQNRFTNGKTARDAFMQENGTKGMTARFESLWKSEHPHGRRGRRKIRS